jgi:phosphoribosylanthranilate isomerase
LIRIKICGITRDEDLVAASDNGADAVGFVVGVPSSPRSLSLERSAKLVGQVPVFVKSVLVMVPNCIDEIAEAYKAVRPDALQLHGHGLPSVEEIKEAAPGAALIRGISLKQGEAAMTVENAASFDAVLLDTYVPGKHGGTGMIHDWETSRRICKEIRPKRLILAGGLKSSNVQEAIRTVRPYAVDVSTGVEAGPGVKSPEKMKNFIERVRETTI